MDNFSGVVQEVTKFIGLSDKCQAAFAAGVFETVCLKMLVSKLLGFAVIGGSLLYKVPQILKIINIKSVYGLSFFSTIIELFAFTITLGYNVRNGFPFSTWGEYVFMIMQTIAILFLFSRYDKGFGITILGLWGVYGSFSYALMTPSLIKDEHLPFLQTSTIPLFILSRATQIISNFANGNVGALSGVTVFLQFAGSASRVFTTIQEVDDQIILFGFLIGLVLNTTLFLQTLFMKGGEAPKVEETKNKESKKNK